MTISLVVEERISKQRQIVEEKMLGEIKKNHASVPDVSCVATGVA